MGMGVDIVELDRVKSIQKKFPGRFEQKILSPEELSGFRQPSVAYLASRFAAKEAGVKALGTGFSQGITMHHLKIVKSQAGGTSLFFSGPARARFDSLGADKVHLSLTHGRDSAVAVVILERDEF